MIMKTLLLLLLPLTLLAQKKEIKIYDSKGGIQNITPSRIIEITKDEIKVFEAKNGVKEVLPTQIIEDNKIYETKGGVKDIINFKVIELPIIEE